MGYWGSGLYSNDYALDLRSTIGALARLPLPDDQLLEMLVEMEKPDALKGQSPDYEVFWLTAAQQFARKGIDSKIARERALSILAECEGELLQEWRPAAVEKLVSEIRLRPDRPRKTLKSPQPFLFEVGDLFVFPTRQGKPPNTYFPSWEAEKVWVKRPGAETMRDGHFIRWEPDGWGAALVIHRAHALGYLAYYQLLTHAHAFGDKPTLDQLLDSSIWAPRRPGTFPKTHYKRMRLESVGRIGLDERKVAPLLHPERSSISRAIQDICFINDMSVLPTSSAMDPEATYPNAIANLESITKR